MRRHVTPPALRVFLCKGPEVIVSSIKTERLVWCPLRVSDADEMASVLADGSLYEFTGGDPPTGSELATRYQQQTAGSDMPGEHWCDWIIRVGGQERAGSSRRRSLEIWRISRGSSVRTTRDAGSQEKLRPPFAIGLRRTRSVEWRRTSIHVTRRPKRSRKGSGWSDPASAMTRTRRSGQSSSPSPHIDHRSCHQFDNAPQNHVGVDCERVRCRPESRVTEYRREPSRSFNPDDGGRRASLAGLSRDSTQPCEGHRRAPRSLIDPVIGRHRRLDADRA